MTPRGKSSLLQRRMHDAMQRGVLHAPGDESAGPVCSTRHHQKNPAGSGVHPAASLRARPNKIITLPTPILELPARLRRGALAR